MDQFFFVSLTYATFGVITKEGVITEIAPIARWALNMEWHKARKYWLKKGALIIEINADNLQNNK